MDQTIEAAVATFRKVFFAGIPIMLRQNETAFLSAMCVAAGVDALSGYRYAEQEVKNGEERFTRFIREIFTDG